MARPIFRSCAAGALLLAACSDDNSGSANEAGDTGADTAVARDGGASVDAEDVSTFEPIEGCSTAAPLDGAFELLPDQPRGQIHASAAFSGDGVWVVYNQPASDSSNFEVWAIKVACDGTVAVPAFKVSTSFSDNQVDPSVAVSGDRVMFVWPRDSGASPVNLTIETRVVDAATGDVVRDEETLDIVQNRESVAANAWMTDIAALPDGFAVATAWADPTVTGFQVGVQRFDAAGATVGELVTVAADSGASQVYPNIAADLDGNVYLSWTDTFVEGDDVVRHALQPAASPDSVTTALASTTLGSSSDYAAGPTGDVYLAFATEGERESDVYVRDGTLFDESQGEARVGLPTRLDFVPAVAAGQDRSGALAWHQLVSGTNTEFFVAAIDPIGGIAGDAINLTVEPPARPYTPALTWVGGNVYFVAWTEGTNDNLTMRAEFVELPPP